MAVTLRDALADVRGEAGRLRDRSVELRADAREIRREGRR
jgi:hypothetical protein